MGIDIAELYREELAKLNDAVDIFGIPSDVFGECGTSYLFVVAADDPESKRCADPERIRMRSKAASKFERLCGAVPRVPKGALSALSMAYGAFLMATENGQDMSGLNASGGSETLSIQVLTSIAEMRGVALGSAFGPARLPEDVLKIVLGHMARKKMLSDAASKIHVENRAAKADVFAWLDANFSTCASMDDAAGRMAGKLVPHTYRTVRDWVGQWKKLRSASTP